jgi:hypothetical protein
MAPLTPAPLAKFTMFRPLPPTGDLRLPKKNSPRELPPMLEKNPLKTNMNLFGPKMLRAKRANDLFKMLATLPAPLGAPRGPPGGGLLTPGLLLTGGPSYRTRHPHEIALLWATVRNDPTVRKLSPCRSRIRAPSAPARNAKFSIFCPPPPSPPAGSLWEPY